MRYLGVSRAEVFSPNRSEGDMAVFRAVAHKLERHGNSVVCMTEQQLTENGIPCGIDGIFQMCRSNDALALLEKATVPVTNTVQGVKNCQRAAQTEMLNGTGLVPDSLICSTNRVPHSWNKYPCWIKRGDAHAVEKDDVQFMQNKSQCMDAIKRLADRGIDTCVIQEHVCGWLVKFYGVKGFGLTDCYAAQVKESKFGQEIHNDTPDGASIDIDALRTMAEGVSELLGVDIYGGDAVVAPDGTITLIDFNDWPSFRTCTVGAAQKIAELIMSRR